MNKDLLLGAAVAGLLVSIGATGCSAGQKDASSDSGSGSMRNMGGGEKHVCKGWNACKGQGADGKNACKGQGACATVKHECKGNNDCKGLGGCKTDKNACYGQNDCKGKGGCNVPNKKYMR